MYRKIRSKLNIDQLQKDIDELITLSQVNGMKINLDKVKTIIFTKA